VEFQCLIIAYHGTHAHTYAPTRIPIRVAALANCKSALRRARDGDISTGQGGGSDRGGGRRRTGTKRTRWNTKADTRRKGLSLSLSIEGLRINRTLRRNVANCNRENHDTFREIKPRALRSLDPWRDEIFRWRARTPKSRTMYGKRLKQSRDNESLYQNHQS